MKVQRIGKNTQSAPGKTAHVFAFVAGFERCMTTALASYLTRGGYCELLVEGVKEPWLFSSDLAAARRVVADRAGTVGPKRIFLDASVQRWVGSFESQGFAGLGEGERPGRPSRVAPGAGTNSAGSTAMLFRRAPIRA